MTISNDSAGSSAFNTIEVLAASIAIFEHNKGYVKETSIEDDFNNKNYSNKEILRNFLSIDVYSKPSNLPNILVTDSHREQARKIRDYTKKEIFNLISAQKSYNVTLYEILNQEYVTLSNLGFVASAPLYFKYSTEKDFFKEKVKDIKSNHVGMIGGNAILDDFEIIKIRKSKNYEGWIILGICEGNLFLFFTKSESFSRYKLGDKIHITGTVKDHVIENDSIPTTKINRVYERIEPNATNGLVRADSNSNVFGQWTESLSGSNSIFS